MVYIDTVNEDLFWQPYCECVWTLSLVMNHRIGGELGQSLHEFGCFTLSLYKFVPKDTLTATTRKLFLEKIVPFNMLNMNLAWSGLRCASVPVVFNPSYKLHLQCFAVTHVKLSVLRAADHYLGIFSVIPRKDVSRPGSQEAAAAQQFGSSSDKACKTWRFDCGFLQWRGNVYFCLCGAFSFSFHLCSARWLLPQRKADVQMLKF